jgi:hypothetical protein
MADKLKKFTETYLVTVSSSTRLPEYSDAERAHQIVWQFSPYTKAQFT